MGVQRQYVPHLEGLISGKMELKGQGRGGTITICHAQLKKAILHIKTAIVRIFICPSVPLISFGPVGMSYDDMTLMVDFGNFTGLI